MDTEVPLPIQLTRISEIDDVGIYHHFLNWVRGEFDLYLQVESRSLQVYFPNGWFNITSFKDQKKHRNIIIHVKGKSKTACIDVMHQLELIYQHVLLFNQKKPFNDINCG